MMLPIVNNHHDKYVCVYCLEKNKCLENPYANNDDYKTLANVKKTIMLVTMIIQRR